ncbi:hypothetical protein LY90DRAFT_388544 [Neocallimastix californiae]|uniref:Chromatin modification-related protein n=1 Tax=Neocallimastix californiae TaxID=1754190 RepID=A0A1Y2AX89_9FUNG|nr:hypothetical protein LY90DRAFT_388544 [Neocallimastix californiae]|eukprot:ORY26910.1 hypothetical protein LY90DRAFT_388544 [Neocallimastix californiae]
MLNSNHDTSIFFEEYIASIDSLPSEIHQHCKELREKDEQYQKIREQISHEYTSIYRGFFTPNPNESTIIGNVRKEMKETQSLADEKVEISEKTLRLIGLHIKRLKETLSKIQSNNPTSSSIDTKNSLLTPKTEETKSSDHSHTHGHSQKSSRSQHTHSNINLKNRKSNTVVKNSVARKRRKVENNEAVATSTTTNETHREFNANNEPLYCICRQISYGNMIACDNQKNCPHEWFHYECVGLVEPPKGSWYCPDCRAKMNKKNSGESESEEETNH